MTNNLTTFITKDGSPTLYSSDFEAYYHSTHGALQESLHVYIDKGLIYQLKKIPNRTLDVLEYGFGTGLNALLTYKETLSRKRKINYVGIEAYPVQWEIIENLDYLDGSLLKDFQNLHDLNWNVKHQITPLFSLEKKQCFFEEFSASEEFDLIYYDAFGPGTQAQLWEGNMLHFAFQSLRPNGVLVTFCAKGSFKRALKKIGFEVESVEGPPGKREMTRAIKPSTNIQTLY